MKRKKNLLLIIVMAFFLLIGNVKAAEEEEELCKPTELSALRSMAANVKVAYFPTSEVVESNTPNFETDHTTSYLNYMDIKIYNINTKLEVIVKAKGIEESYRSTHVGPDGTITLRQTPQNEVVNYTFEVRSFEGGCYDRVLRKIKLSLPRYNFYSQLAACSDIPDFYLCQEYTTIKIDGATFYDKVDEYKAKLLSIEEQEKADENNTGAVSQVLSNVSKYKYVIVGVVVVIGVLLTIFILNRKKSVL